MTLNKNKSFRLVVTISENEPSSNESVYVEYKRSFFEIKRLKREAVRVEMKRDQQLLLLSVTF